MVGFCREGNVVGFAMPRLYDRGGAPSSLPRSRIVELASTKVHTTDNSVTLAITNQTISITMVSTPNAPNLLAIRSS